MNLLWNDSQGKQNYSFIVGEKIIWKVSMCLREIASKKLYKLIKKKIEIRN